MTNRGSILASAREAPPPAITRNGIKQRTFDADDTFVAMTDASVDATLRWSPPDEGNTRAVDEHSLTWWLLAWGKPRIGASTVQELIDSCLEARSTLLTDDALVQLLNACTARWVASRRRPLQGALDIKGCITDPVVPEDAEQFVIDLSSFRKVADGEALGAGDGAAGGAATTPPARQAAAARPARVTRAGTGRTAPALAAEPEAATVATARTLRRQPDAVSPPEVAWLDRLQIFSVLDPAQAADIAPFWQASRMGLMLGAGASPEELADDSSYLRITSDLIRPHLIEYLRLSSDSATPAALAAGFADFWRDGTLPELYSSGSLTPLSIRADLLDGCRLRAGGMEARRVEEARLGYALNLPQVAVLGRLLKAAQAAERAPLLQRLLNLFLPERTTSPWHTNLLDLEAQLVRRARTIDANLGADPPVPPGELISALRTDLELHQAPSIPVAPEGGQDRPMRPLRQEAVLCAQNAPAFVEVWAELQHVDFAADPLWVWDLVLSAQSTILTRFALRNDVALLPYHPIYGKLQMIRHELINTFARAQILGPDGGPPPEQQMEQWRWCQKAFDLFCKRQVLAVDWVSHESGFLGVRALRDVNAIAPVPKDQHYSVISVCEGIRDFVHPTFVQAGYSATSNGGYTMRTLFDLHIQRLRAGYGRPNLT